jgi:hypothetical protein
MSKTLKLQYLIDDYELQNILSPNYLHTSVLIHYSVQKLSRK